MVKLSCGVQCTRLTLFVLNILFLMAGFALLGTGIYVKVSRKFDIAFSEHINTKIIGGNAIEWVGVSMIIVAVFTILLSGFGCLGAVFKNRLFLYLYAIVLSFLIIFEIATFIFALSARSRINDSYKSGFQELFIDSYRDNNTDVKQLIEDMEREFQCCGVHNVTDYYIHDYPVPASCHQDGDFQKPIFSKGCAHEAIKWFWKQFPIIGSALGGILLIEIFDIIAAIALGIAISHSSYDTIYSSYK